MKIAMACLVGLVLSVGIVGAEPVVEGRVRLSSGEAAVGAQVLVFDLADLSRYVRATTDESGQFVVSLRALGQGQGLPEGFGLGQNYPNPFNPGTVIPYELAADGYVRLEVFNLLGQRVATLVEGEQAAGRYTAAWDARDASGYGVAAGVYIYRLTAGGGVATRRMVLVDGVAVGAVGAGSGVARLQAVGAEGYGLTVSGVGLETYVDADFRVEMGSVVVVVDAADAIGRGKMAAGGILGDVNNDGQVDSNDALLVTLYSGDSSTAMPNNGDISLGDVNGDGQVDSADAYIITLYSVDPSDPTLPIGIGLQVEGVESVLSASRSLVFIMDLSGSMDDAVAGGGTRLEAAKAALAQVLTGVPTDGSQEYALTTFGGGCDVEVPIGFTADAAVVVDYVAGVVADGDTPLAAALRRGQHLALDEASSDDVLLVLLSDGEETCDGDPVGVARLIGQGVRAKVVASLGTQAKVISVNAIGFGVEPGSAADQQIQAIAKEAGGNYFRASETADLAVALGQASGLVQTRVPTLSGRVTDEDGNPIQGALVQLRNMQENTDANGRYLFPAGVQGVDSLIVTASGYARYEAEVYLFDVDKEFDVRLTGGGGGGGGHVGEERVFSLPGGGEMAFVWIGPGVFQMGSPSSDRGCWDSDTKSWEHCEDGGPVHEVEISRGFWLGKYEVTVGQFRRFVEATGYDARNSCNMYDGDRWFWRYGFMNYPRNSPSDDHPVVCVSWDEVSAYAEWLSGETGVWHRLPTEAEWEYACRAGSTTRWSFGDDESQLGEYAWYSANARAEHKSFGSLGHTQVVGLKRANAWGLHDMHGNVYEWVQDWYGSSYYNSSNSRIDPWLVDRLGSAADYRSSYYNSSPRANPQGPNTGSYRVCRGGSFLSHARFVWPAFRCRNLPDHRVYSVGVRLLRAVYPVAVARVEAISVGVGGQVVLRGDESRDPADGQLTYHWSGSPSNPSPVSFSSNDSENASVVRATLTDQGYYQFVLEVESEAGLWSAPDTTVVVVARSTEVQFPLPGNGEMEFVWISPGTFQMGSPESEEGHSSDEGPVHEVEISRGFWLGKYEVTQSQWEAVMEDNRSRHKGADRPVEQVSWDNVQEFIGRLNDVEGSVVYRLPTEAEWEYACRAGTQTRWSFGDDEDQLGNYAWYRGNNSPEGTKEVGGKLPNPWGLYDMHGNVREWVQDDRDNDYYNNSPRVDPLSTSGYRLLVRGGAFHSRARRVRSASRSTGDHSGDVSSERGFRLLKIGEAVDLSAGLPVAVARKEPASVDVGGQVTLRGDRSIDPSGGRLTYHWSELPSNPFPVSFSSNDSENAFAVRVALTDVGAYQFVLEVANEAGLRSAPDTVRVWAWVRGASREFSLPGGAVMDFVEVGPGTFQMGSPESEEGHSSGEGPMHEVEISQGFYLGKYEVTQGQWEAVMRSKPSYHKGTDLLPVERVSWDDVQKFIGRLNAAAGSVVYRLPTEAEWEYACRAGTQTRWSFGDNEDQLGDYAWYRGNNSPDGTKEVGGKLPNPWGLYDMHGNVWEWVQDWYGRDYWATWDNSYPRVNPQGPASGSERVIRGGSFWGKAEYVRSAERFGTSTAGGSATGFRLLRIR